MSQQIEIGTYCSVNKQYVERVQKMKTDFFDEGKPKNFDVFAVQQTKAKEVENGFLGLSSDTKGK